MSKTSRVAEEVLEQPLLKSFLSKYCNYTVNEHVVRLSVLTVHQNQLCIETFSWPLLSLFKTLFGNSLLGEV